jgi:hypothetical protein
MHIPTDSQSIAHSEKNSLIQGGACVDPKVSRVALARDPTVDLDIPVDMGALCPQ